MLTKQELLIAADCAEAYPAGMAVHWGTGPLVDLCGDTLAVALSEHPDWLPYG